jgi:phosphoglycolate phosphatase
MPRRALVFDLDGTLVDTAPDLHATLNVVLADHGRASLDLDQVRNLVGQGAGKLVERGFRMTGAPLDPEPLKAAVAEFLAYYGDNLSVFSRPFPETRDLLARFKTEGYRLGICTNKPEHLSRKLLADIAFLTYFDALFGGDTLPVSKPDPAPLLSTLKAIGATPETGVMIGDSPTDVATAKAAGVPVIAVDFGYSHIPAAELGADAVISAYAELPAALAAIR